MEIFKKLPSIKSQIQIKKALGGLLTQQSSHIKMKYPPHLQLYLFFNLKLEMESLGVVTDVLNTVIFSLMERFVQKMIAHICTNLMKIDKSIL